MTHIKKLAIALLLFSSLSPMAHALGNTAAVAAGTSDTKVATGDVWEHAPAPD